MSQSPEATPQPLLEAESVALAPADRAAVDGADHASTQQPDPSSAHGAASGILSRPTQTPMFRAMQASRYQRKELLSEIEQYTGRRLICYVASPSAHLRRSDIHGFTDLVHDLTPSDDVDLMLTTYGGEPDAAARIGHLLRKVVPHGTLRAVIPEIAKSAGTTLAVGMDRLVLGDTSELGPVDPFIKIPGQPGYQPAQAYLDAHQTAVRRAAGQEPSATAWTDLLTTFNPLALELCDQAVAHTRSVLERLLAGRHSRPGDAAATTIAASLLNPGRRTHGAVITAEEASTIGLPVEYLPHGDELWQAYWRLHCLQTASLEAGCRLFESTLVSLQQND